MLLVKDDSLECYGWLANERLIILEDLTDFHGLPEKFYRVKNIDRNEIGGVLESQTIETN